MENRAERMVRPGEIYRHFKGKLYQIVAVAVHSETGEKMVVYQALYGDFAVYVRPFLMFVSEVEREKYPDEKQKYRFERVELQGEEPHQEEEANRERDKERANPSLMAFLDAKSVEEKIACLREWRESVTQADLDNVYVALDMQARPGSVKEQLDEVIRCLAMQQHYEGGRLR